MTAPRFEELRLEYGRHSGRFPIPEASRPVVISGRNGTGKTTLLEALLRGLYGFSRRKPEERRLLALRQPWSGRPAAIEVWLRAADGCRIAVHRDLASDEVVAVERDTGDEVFRGDGNPAGVRSASRHYQELLRNWIGFESLEPYRGTAWIAQGELVDTRLDDQLLRAAAGTHRRVEVALGELRSAFEALTRESLELGGRRKNRPRDLEMLVAEREDTRVRLESARAARERRQPLLDRRLDLRAQSAAVEGEIARLEAAYRPITERRSLAAEEQRGLDRQAVLSDALRWVEEARSELRLAEAEAAAARGAGVYPADFERRAGEAAALWDRMEELQAADPDRAPLPAAPEVLPVTAAMAGVALVAGATTAALYSLTAGAILAVTGLSLLGVHLIRRRRAAALDRARSHRRREWRGDVESLRSRIAALADGVPAPELSPLTLPEHRRAFDRQEGARLELERARRRWSDAMGASARALGRPASAMTDPIPELDAAREETRTELARLQLQLQELPSAPPLPEGVEPTVAAVEAALDERRSLRNGLREEETRLDLELRDLERASEDAFSLERQSSLLDERIRDMVAEVAVRRAAWELVRDAYAEFRATDQDRLLSAVNRHLERLSGGSLGPVVAEGELSAASIVSAGRELALDSPPLSFGEKHVALLAIRLGAADFLAGEGTSHPLIVDEPFTHLDEVRSRAVWDLLEALAAERQVIVTTQDRLVLDHLGVEPDLEIPEAVREVSADMAGMSGHEPVGSPEPPVKVRDEPEPQVEPEPRAEPSPSPESTQAQLELG